MQIWLYFYLEKLKILSKETKNYSGQTDNLDVKIILHYDSLEGFRVENFL